MSSLESLTRLPDDFDGLVRLFPLPGVVTFPHVMQPLHIFEPRYCDMLTDALSSNRLLAMATLASGWESDYEGRPAIEKLACIGRIVSHTPTDDDRHNILLLGIRRVRILKEVNTNQTYRMAQVEVLDDVYSPDQDADRPLLKRLLLDEFRNYIPDSALAQESFSQLLDSEMPLGVVSDIISYTVGISTRAKLRLLAELNVDQRARLLIKALNDSSTTQSESPAQDDSLTPGFPPPFSLN